jgi:hypothetical protein
MPGPRYKRLPEHGTDSAAYAAEQDRRARALARRLPLTACVYPTLTVDGEQLSEAVYHYVVTMRPKTGHPHVLLRSADHASEIWWGYPDLADAIDELHNELTNGQLSREVRDLGVVLVIHPETFHA